MNKVVLCDNVLYFLSIKISYTCKYDTEIKSAIEDFLNGEPYELIKLDEFGLNAEEHGSYDEWQFY
jgi:predicted nucleotide-binding protein (sugar kinase/HSP70/actin superfamily)